MEQTHKNVLITGATCGIGRELARIFARNGYNLVMVGRSQHELDRTEREILEESDVKILTISKDLFQPQAAFELYEEVKWRNIPVHILVNDAGQGLYGEFVHTDIYRELNIIQLNISSLVVLTKLFLKDMVRNGEGRVLNLSSIASKSPGPWQSVYHGTKAFVQSFTEAIREEVKNSGVTVTALLPGVTDTDFFRKAGMEASKIVQDKSRMAPPAQVAQDGYDALMKGQDMVVSGFANKLELVMDNLTPDSKLAAKLYKQQEPVKKKHPQGNADLKE